MAKDTEEKKWIEKSIKILSGLIEVAELAIAISMVIIIFLGLGYLVSVFFTTALKGHIFLSSK